MLSNSAPYPPILWGFSIKVERQNDTLKASVQFPTIPTIFSVYIYVDDFLVEWLKLAERDYHGKKEGSFSYDEIEDFLIYKEDLESRSGAVVARLAHNQEDGGCNSHPLQPIYSGLQFCELGCLISNLRKVRFFHPQPILFRWVTSETIPLQKDYCLAQNQDGTPFLFKHVYHGIDFKWGISSNSKTSHLQCEVSGA